MKVAVLLASLLLAAAAFFLFGILTVFGSGGFGGSSPPPHEGLRQVALLTAVVAPLALGLVSSRWAVVVPLLQLVVVLVAPLGT